MVLKLLSVVTDAPAKRVAAGNIIFKSSEQLGLDRSTREWRSGIAMGGAAPNHPPQSRNPEFPASSILSFLPRIGPTQKRFAPISATYRVVE
jgi:hypothetical protein